MQRVIFRVILSLSQGRCLVFATELPCLRVDSYVPQDYKRKTELTAEEASIAIASDSTGIASPGAPPFTPDRGNIIDVRCSEGSSRRTEGQDKGVARASGGSRITDDLPAAPVAEYSDPGRVPMRERPRKHSKFYKARKSGRYGLSTDAKSSVVPHLMRDCSEIQGANVSSATGVRQRQPCFSDPKLFLLALHRRARLFVGKPSSSQNYHNPTFRGEGYSLSLCRALLRSR